jgi:hypothetical protein
MVSINTRKGFSQVGAPLGRSLAANEEGEKRIPDIIRESHKGRANDKVNRRCLEALNIYGIRPIKLINITKINKGETREDNPFK